MRDRTRLALAKRPLKKVRQRKILNKKGSIKSTDIESRVEKRSGSKPEKKKEISKKAMNFKLSHSLTQN